MIEIKRADVPLTLAYAGRVAGFRTVEIRAMVSGTIMKREYAEGARVKQGDTLFRIDPRPYQAVYDRATAQLAQAKATAFQAEENFNRIQELANRQVATPKQLDDARAARDQSRAAIQSVEADIENARLNLEFTVVKAPVAGPTALLSPPEGSIAQAQQTVLTTITQLDPAYVNFSITDAELREFRAFSDNLDKPLSDDDITVTLQYGDGTTYPQDRQDHHVVAERRPAHRHGADPLGVSERRRRHSAGPVRPADHQGHHPAEGDRHSAAGGLAGSARHVRLCGEQLPARPKCAR